MEPRLGFDAFDADAGADDLGEAVDVHGVQVEAFFDLLAHAFGPGFGPEDAHLELQVGEIDAHLLADFRQVEGEGRGADEDGGAEILEQHDLAAGLAAGDGNHRGPQAFGAVMERPGRR